MCRGDEVAYYLKIIYKQKRKIKMAKTANKQIKIKLIKSLIGCSEAQRKVAKALGFTKKDQVVEHSASPVIKGMINKISHLLEVSEG